MKIKKMNFIYDLVTVPLRSDNFFLGGGGLRRELLYIRHVKIDVHISICLGRGNRGFFFTEEIQMNLIL